MKSKYIIYCIQLQLVSAPLFPPRFSSVACPRTRGKGWRIPFADYQES